MAAAVRVLPAGIELDVASGESLMTAARRLGCWWPTVCGGNGECGACWAVVEEGAEYCSPCGPVESATLGAGMHADEPGVRLACQLEVSGPVVVRRRAVRAARSEGDRS